jgi:hypothetical protein
MRRFSRYAAALSAAIVLTALSATSAPDDASIGEAPRWIKGNKEPDHADSVYVLNDCTYLEHEVMQKENGGECQRHNCRNRKDQSKRRMLLKALSRIVETRRLIHLVIAVHQTQIGSKETTCYRHQITRQICRTGFMLPTA